MSKAFDTIDRSKLVAVLAFFLSPVDVHLITILLADTTLQLRLGTRTFSTFSSNHGTPQGDALSPLLFIIYLEAALRDLYTTLNTIMGQLNATIYADDVDFVHPTRTPFKRFSLLLKMFSPAGPSTLMRLRLSQRKFSGPKIHNGVAPGNWEPYLAIMRKVHIANSWRIEHSPNSGNYGFDTVSSLRTSASAYTTCTSCQSYYTLRYLGSDRTGAYPT